MPLASQLAEAAAAHRPDAPICAAAQHVDRHELPRDALSACGYCDLLASHAYAPAAAAPVYAAARAESTHRPGPPAGRGHAAAGV
nr:hypothetical protein [Burkholderia sp. Cy-647]